MNTEQKIEGNKLIAEFMGGIVEKFTWRKYEPMGVTFDKQVHGLQAHVLEDLEYHTSWDWLKPVIDKLGEQYDKGELVHRGQLFDLSLFATIDLAWRCVVETITANTQKQNQ